MEAEEEECERLMAEEETQIAEEMRPKAEEEERASLTVKEWMHISEGLRLNSE